MTGRGIVETRERALILAHNQPELVAEAPAMLAILREVADYVDPVGNADAARALIHRIKGGIT